MTKPFTTNKIYLSFLLALIFVPAFKPTTLFAQNQHPSLALPEGAIARLGNGRAYNVEYSGDGMRLAVASSIGVWIYDANTLRPLSLLTKHKAPVVRLAFSPDGRILISVDSPGTMHLWDTQTGEYKRVQRLAIPIISMAISPDGKTLVTADIGQKIRFWDMQMGAEIQLFDRTRGDILHIYDVQKGSIYSLAFSPDGLLLATGNENSDIDLWDAETGRHKLKLEGHDHLVCSVNFSPDGKTVVSGSWDGTICLWDAVSGKQINVFESENKYVFEKVVFSPDGSLIACAGNIGQVYLLDGNTAAHKKTLLGHTQRVNDIAFSPDMCTLASSSSLDGSVRIWEVATGENIRTISNHFGENTCFTWSVDGKKIIVPGLYRTLYVWDAETGKIEKTYVDRDWRDKPKDVAVSPLGKTFAIASVTASSEKVVFIFDKETGEMQKILKGPTDDIHRVAYSPDGKMIAAASRDHFVWLWDAETGELKRTDDIFDGHKAIVMSVVFSPDGKVIASGGHSQSVLLWDPETGEQNNILKGKSTVAAANAFSPDGKTLAISRLHNTISLFDLDTGMERKLPFDSGLPGYAFCLDFSPDGKTIALGSTNGTVAVLDVGIGEMKFMFEGHIDVVNRVAFSPDGKTLASNSNRGVMYLWRVGE